MSEKVYRGILWTVFVTSIVGAIISLVIAVTAALKYFQ